MAWPLNLFRLTMVNWILFMVSIMIGHADRKKKLNQTAPMSRLTWAQLFKANDVVS